MTTIKVAVVIITLFVCLLALGISFSTKAIITVILGTGLGSLISIPFESYKGAVYACFGISFAIVAFMVYTEMNIIPEKFREIFRMILSIIKWILIILAIVFGVILLLGVLHA